MLSNRISLGLAAFLLVVSAGMTARGQDHELAGAGPLRTGRRTALRQLGGAEARVVLHLRWLVLAHFAAQQDHGRRPEPDAHGLHRAGVARLVRRENSLDTSAPSIWNWGDRMELGYIDGHHGFMFTSLETQSQTDDITLSQRLRGLQRPGVRPGRLALPGYGPATGRRHRQPAIIGETPVNFASLYVQNKSRLDGAEALYIYRPSELPLGGDTGIHGRRPLLRTEGPVLGRRPRRKPHRQLLEHHLAQRDRRPGNRRAMVTSPSGGSAFRPTAASRRASMPSRSTRTASWRPDLVAGGNTPLRSRR